MTVLTPQELLQAMEPCWKYANRTDDDNKFLHPEYRRALTEVWEDITVAMSMKHIRTEIPSITLNVAMTRLVDD